MSSCRCNDIVNCNNKIKKLNYRYHILPRYLEGWNEITQDLDKLESDSRNAFDAANMQQLLALIHAAGDDMKTVHDTLKGKIYARIHDLELELKAMEAEDEEYHAEEEEEEEPLLSGSAVTH